MKLLITLGILVAVAFEASSSPQYSSSRERGRGPPYYNPYYNRGRGPPYSNRGAGRGQGRGNPLCGCPYNIDEPVCASNHKVYRNVCFMRCDFSHKGKKLRVVRKGRHCPICGACLGPPVCGQNGKTYHSICALNCDWEENTKVAHKGACTSGSKSRDMDYQYY